MEKSRAQRDKQAEEKNEDLMEWRKAILKWVIIGLMAGIILSLLIEI